MIVSKNFLGKFSFDPEVRRKAHWHYVYKRSKKNNLQVYVPHVVWLKDQAFLDAKKEWTIPGMPNDRRFFLFNSARNTRRIPGDTVDIGVRFGSSSFFIVRGRNNPEIEHHLFDSFEGLSEPTIEDKTNDRTPWKKGVLKSEEEYTKKNLLMFNNCKFYKGWVPDRFPDVADKRFSLVHIDLDLYQPTLESLKFFYGRMNPGGVIICDDYGLDTCPGTKKAVDEFFVDKEPVFHIPTGQALIVKQ